MRTAKAIPAFSMLAAFAVAGCAIDGDAPVGGDPLAADVERAPTSDEAMAMPEAAGSSEGSAAPSNDGTATTDPGATSSAPPADAPPASPAPDMRLEPLEVGRAWTYTITAIGVDNYDPCPNGTRDVTVLGASTRDGRDVYQVNRFCPQPVVDTWQSKTGTRDATEWYQNGQWLRSLDEPAEAGHTWMTGGITLKYEAVDAIKVPAGTFTSCLAVVRTNPEVRQTYCRGVGLVKEEVRRVLEFGFFKTTVGYSGVLTKKNF